MTVAETARRAAAHKTVVLSVICLTQFLVVLDALITTVALPSIQRELHFSTTSLSWVVNLYALMFGGFLLLGGHASDLFGRRRLFVVGGGDRRGHRVAAGSVPARGGRPR